MGEAFQRKSLFQLTLPLFLFGIMSVGVTFADTMLLANYSDDLAASVSMANQVLGIGYDLSGLMSVGVLILIAQFLGRNDVARAREIAQIGFIASACFGVLMAAGVAGGATFYTDWINTPPEIRDGVLLYIYSISVTLILYGFINTAIATLRGFGRTMEILWYGVIGNVVYLGAKYVCVYGVWIVPEMGIHGAALSTVIMHVDLVYEGQAGTDHSSHSKGYLAQFYSNIETFLSQCRGGAGLSILSIVPGVPDCGVGGDGDSDAILCTDHYPASGDDYRGDVLRERSAGRL